MAWEAAFWFWAQSRFCLAGAAARCFPIVNTTVLRLLAAALVLAAGSPMAMAQAIDFAQARQRLLAGSDQLAAADKAVQSAQLRCEGVQKLGGPALVATGMAFHYDLQARIDLDPARQQINGVASQLPPQMGGILGQLPQLPGNYSLQQSGQRANAGLALLWPLYNGGLADAVRSGCAALADEALAAASGDEQALQALLVQRYFGAQLAARAAQLRASALDMVRAHDAAAQQMLATGVISRLERLQAQAALADAQQQGRKAQDEAQLAATALARTLKAVVPLRPSSPLFVHSQPLPPLAGFIDSALQRHPGLSTVQAKRREAGALHEAQEALRRPQLLGFGIGEIGGGSGLSSTRRPNWAAGVAVYWQLWDSVDRDRLAASGQRKIEQAEFAEAQARSDIALLVEKNWLAAEHARSQYLAQQAQEDLARELLRLREAGLREGTSTPLELIEARVNLAKVLTERAQAANYYVQALAALLQSCGQGEDFARYLARADILIPADAP